eukprot:COSAG02_NODE_363_length_23785_cov_21.830828_3_plen_73_part_00
MAGSRPTAWVGQFPLAWERERVVVSFRVLPNVRHVKGNVAENHAAAARGPAARAMHAHAAAHAPAMRWGMYT